MGRGTYSPSVQPMAHGKLVLHASWAVQGILLPWVMGCTERIWCSVQHHMAHDPWAFCHSAWSMTHGEKVAEWAPDPRCQLACGRPSHHTLGTFSVNYCWRTWCAGWRDKIILQILQFYGLRKCGSPLFTRSFSDDDSKSKRISNRQTQSPRGPRVPCPP